MQAFGDVANSIFHHKRHLELVTEMSNDSSALAAHANLGALFEYQGNYQKVFKEVWGKSAGRSSACRPSPVQLLLSFRRRTTTRAASSSRVSCATRSTKPDTWRTFRV